MITGEPTDTGKEFDRAKLRQLRKSRHLTIAALARKAGVLRATVSNIERGVTKIPHDDTVGYLANELGVDPNDLWRVAYTPADQETP